MVSSRSILAYVLAIGFTTLRGCTVALGHRHPVRRARARRRGACASSPQDTSLNVNATNYSGDAVLLTTYTWPDNRAANAVLMKFDLSSLPAGAFITGRRSTSRWWSTTRPPIRPTW